MSGVQDRQGATLPARWSALWTEHPDRALLRVGDGGWLTAGRLDDLTRSCAAQLADVGVQPGDRVLLAMPASIEFVCWHIGALRLGAVSVPVNPRATQRELAHVVRDSGPRAALTSDAAAGTGAGRAGWIAAAGPTVVLLDPAVTRGTARVAPNCGRVAGLADPPLDRAERGQPALLMYTSGTTGRPKGAELTHRNLSAGVDSLLAAWAWTAEDRLAMALPLFHVHGLAVGLHATLTAGASATLLPSFDAGALLHRVRDDHATLVFGVPTMYHRLVRDPAAGALRPLRLCVSGSAALPPALWTAVRDTTGQRILERYGMTETMLTLSNPLDGERRPGTVGLPLPGVEARLAAGEPVPAELQVRGPSVFAGYWRLPAATRSAFTADGWFRTGDLAVADEQGYVRIVGRRSEMIVTGGHNVYPQEVEDVLAGADGVREVAVVGVPSDEYGEVVVAFVVGDPEARDRMVAHCARHLSRYKQPREIRFMSELPRNSIGKVVRGELRAR